MRIFPFLLTVVIFVLFYVIARPYQYSMSPFEFYGISYGFVLLCLIRFIMALLKRPFRKARFLLLFVVLSLMSYYTYIEYKDQTVNFRIQNKISAYLPDVPLNIAYYQRLDPQTVQAYYLDEEPPSNNLSQEKGTKAVYVKKPIPAGQSVDQYTLLFKAPYAINDADISAKQCFNFIMCNYYYSGEVLLDPDSGELLGLSLYNKGIEK
ncbi:hypothetical protein [Paenibacillus thalictri]|uniref:Uncharacterized protein n=1 Tax=Paenibacillus thalictri TaxID=2527873 RepID=A0A4Q9DL13_9BACL|nr:hypothetical protein [Paenibacillus thalictri]TBL75651.1 hypothetical protein EYB31_21895 [Paenibacillus thalictri]